MGWFDRRHDEPPTSAPAPQRDPGSLEALAEAAEGLVRTLRTYGDRIPPRAIVLARTIAHHLQDVVSDPSARLMDVGTRISLERMASAHIPETFDTYLAARNVPGADDILVEQLSTMERVSSNAAARSIQAAQDAFMVQSSFLQEKYGAGYV